MESTDRRPVEKPSMAKEKTNPDAKKGAPGSGSSQKNSHLQATAQTSARSTKRRSLSAGVIPVFLSDTGPLYLLLRAYSYWDFPKGGAKASEEPLAAAVREMREETTIEEVDFPWGYGFQETPPYSRGKVARYYIGRVHTLKVALLPNPESDLVEHHEYRWVTFDQATKLVSDRVLPILQWAHQTLAME